MVQVSAYQVVYMVAMRNCFMTTTLTMLVITVMVVTTMIRCAFGRVTTPYFQPMLINVPLMDIVKVPIVKIIDMAFMTDSDMTAVCPMLVIVSFMLIATHG